MATRTTRSARPPAARLTALLAALLIALPLAMATAAAAVPRPEDGGAAAGAPVLVRVPLEDGRLDLGRTLDAVATALGEQPSAVRRAVDWSIDVESMLGAARLAALDRASGGLLTVSVDATHATVRVDRAAIAARLGDAESATRTWLLRTARVLNAMSPARREFGVTIATDDDPRAPLAAAHGPDGRLPERLVLLVHGLDDPGWMWRDMAPALRAAGHVVARFEYPNDGPIGDAADLLAVTLADLQAQGVAHVDLVVHSMGGLVSRDVLTRRTYYAGDGRGGDRYPAVDRLIMCGTPNHGSKLVRLRAISELKEQLSRTLSGDDGAWGFGRGDGAGEAEVDLTPGSDFLRRLNRRPLATHTQHAIIAGRMSPVTETEVEDLAERVREVARTTGAPSWLHDLVDDADASASRLLHEAVRGLGDGCVSLDSARLDGVSDFTVVEANHVEMIVNVLPGRTAAPPAVSIVLDRLGAAPAAVTTRPSRSP